MVCKMAIIPAKSSAPRTVLPSVKNFPSSNRGFLLVAGGTESM